MILEAFAALIAVPVHEQPVARVHRDDSYHHVAQDAEGSDSAEKAEDQPEASQEFGHDREKREDRGDAAALEHTHGGVESAATPPAERFLGAVSEHDDSENQSQPGERQTAGCRKNSAHENHSRFQRRADQADAAVRNQTRSAAPVGSR